MAVKALVITGAGGGGGGGGGDEIASFRTPVPVPPEFVALMFILKFPDTVGVPEMSPVLVFTESPAGRLVAPKLVGVFVAVIW